MSQRLPPLVLALVGAFVAVVAGLPCTAAANGTLSVSVGRRDLRPLPGVTLQLGGAVNLQGVTDNNGGAEFPGLPPAGMVTITPSRSGFRFEPVQFTIPDLANPPVVLFTAFPTSTDLALSMVSDDAKPLVGSQVNAVITLSNLGTEAATDVTVGFAFLPGLVVEDREATQGALEVQAYQTAWTLAQLDPGASAEVHVRFRASLPDANILAIAVIEELDQADTAPLNNSTVLITSPRAAQARLSLAITLGPGPAKAGETLPVKLTLRNDGPNEATQIAIRSYVPPGAAFVVTTNQPNLDSIIVIPRLAAGAEVPLIGAMFVRFDGTYTLIANVTSFEQELPTGTAWPEARSDFTVQPASSRITLLAFTDPPNPRVGDDVNVLYVAKNEGPDTVTGLKLFTRKDPRLADPTFIAQDHPAPPVPGPFLFGDVLPAGVYTYLGFQYQVNAAGDLTNYFTVEYQDQPIPNAADHAELFIPIKTLPADIGLSLDASPKELTVQSGDPVTIEFPIHNDGPQPARGFIVDFGSQGLATADLDEIIHADHTFRPIVGGYIDVVDPGETVRLRKHFIAVSQGNYTNVADIKFSSQRPDLLIPLAVETVLVHILPGPPPDLGISVSVDKAQVNVGEYAIFFVTVTNRAAQPALSVNVSETSAVEANYAFETVRSYGPGGDDRITTASLRSIPHIEPGGSYSMSRTMRLRKPVTIPYLAKIVGANGAVESDLPPWRATTEVSGVQVASDIASTVLPDRTNVTNGDPVTFAIFARNVSSRLASRIGLDAGESAGFQVLGEDFGGYGYYWDTSRPRDLQSSTRTVAEWSEIGPQEAGFWWISTYTVGTGQLTVGASLSYLDQLDDQATNDLALVQINSAEASANVSVHESRFPPNPSVGDLVLFETEIRNEGPDRVTGLALLESSSTNLQLNLTPAVNGLSGDFATSFLDDYVRLPALEPGQNFVLQRTYFAPTAGDAWRRVRVAGFDQTALGPLPENETTLTVQSAQADLELQFLAEPTVAQAGIPTFVAVRVRNLGPAIATSVKVAVTGPADALSFGFYTYGPRANYDLLLPNVFQTELRSGESATVSFYATPTRVGSVTGFLQVVQSDQVDPHPENNALSFTLNVGPASPIPPILRVRKVRMDFFDHTPIAEIEIDQAALNRLSPFSTFSLEGSSNLRDWEFLSYVGFLPLAPVTFTDHANPGVTIRAFRLSNF